MLLRCCLNAEVKKKSGLLVPAKFPSYKSLWVREKNYERSFVVWPSSPWGNYCGKVQTVNADGFCKIKARKWSHRDTTVRESQAAFRSCTDLNGKGVMPTAMPNHLSSITSSFFFYMLCLTFFYFRNLELHVWLEARCKKLWFHPFPSFLKLSSFLPSFLE